MRQVQWIVHEISNVRLHWRVCVKGLAGAGGGGGGSPPPVAAKGGWMGEEAAGETLTPLPQATQTSKPPLSLSLSLLLAGYNM